MGKIVILLLLVCSILLSIIIYQQTPRYQYEVNIYKIKKEVKAHERAVETFGKTLDKMFDKSHWQFEEN